MKYDGAAVWKSDNDGDAAVPIYAFDACDAVSMGVFYAGAIFQDNILYGRTIIRRSSSAIVPPPRETFAAVVQLSGAKPSMPALLSEEKSFTTVLLS